MVGRVRRLSSAPPPKFIQSNPVWQRAWFSLSYLLQRSRPRALRHLRGCYRSDTDSAIRCCKNNIASQGRTGIILHFSYEGAFCSIRSSWLFPGHLSSNSPYVPLGNSVEFCLRVLTACVTKGLPCKMTSSLVFFSLYVLTYPPLYYPRRFLGASCIISLIFVSHLLQFHCFSEALHYIDLLHSDYITSSVFQFFHQIFVVSSSNPAFLFCPDLGSCFSPDMYS